MCSGAPDPKAWLFLSLEASTFSSIRGVIDPTHQCGWGIYDPGKVSLCQSEVCLDWEATLPPELSRLQVQAS